MPIVSPKIPQGLEELMRGLAKSVIKENPENIYEFAAEYFENLLRDRDGTVDQRYKKFATYKVYKKNKMARKQQRDKDLIPIRPSTAYDLEQGSSSSKQNSDYESIEKIILPPSHMPPRQQLSVSSESEINTSVKQEAFVDVEGTPTRKDSATKDDDDIENMVLDDEMAQAALKIQSSFRGHKVRRDMKDSKNTQVISSIDESVKESGSELNINSDGHVSEIDSEIISNQEERMDDVNILNPTEEVILKDEQDPNQSSLVVDDIVEGSEITKNVSDEGTNSNLPEGEIIPSKDSIDLENKSVDMFDEAQPLEEIESNAVIVTSQEEKVATEKTSQEEMVEVSEPETNDICESSEIEKTLSSEEEKFVGEEKAFKSESTEQEPNISTSPPPATRDDDDDIANMVLDGEMEEAALKIQSAFRGHKVRKDMSSVGVDVPENESLQNQCDLNNDQPESKIDEGLIENSSEISQNEIIAENNLNEEEILGDTEGLDGENQQSESFIVSEGREEEGIQLEQIESIECDKIDNSELIKSTDEILINENSPMNSMTSENEQQNNNEILLSDDDKIITESTQDINSDENVLDVEANVSNDHPETLSIISIESVPIQNETDVNESLIINSQESEIAAIESISNKDEHMTNEEINVEVPLATDSTLNDEIILAETSVECIESPDVQERDISEENVIKSFEDNIPTTPGDNNSVEILKKEDSIKEATGSIESENKIKSLNAFVDASVEHNESPEQLSVESEENLPPNDDIKTELIQATHDETRLVERENSQIETNSSQEENLINDDIGKQISVEEEICEQKIISNLQPEQQQSQDEQLQEENAIVDDILDEDKKESLEKMSSTEIKYEKLQESVDGGKLSPSMERQDTEEKSIDADSPCNSKDASVDEDVEKKAITLENILQQSISPIDIIDEVVNEAAMKAHEILGLTSSDVEQITNPELIKLNSEENIPTGEEIEPIKDEILTPEKEDSEIPEETQNPIDEPLVVMDQTEVENLIEPNLLESDDAINPKDGFSSEDKNEVNLEVPLTTSEPQENLDDIILDDEMEGAAVKIQAAFRGHKTRKETLAMTLKSESENIENENNNESATIVIDQCSEGNEETQDDTELQDTSADVDEIQESEAVTEQENNTEVQEEESASEEQDETNESQAADEGGEGGSGVDDPDEVEPEASGEGETSQTNDDDDVANMVLDEEMEQAALKIQSTFRGHQTRKENKTKPDGPKTEETQSSERNDAAEKLDGEIANLALEEENKVESEETPEKTEKAESKEDEQPESSSTEKSAQQLQDEEDIANIVMDDEMEKTALKIQSAFRGKFKRKEPKDDGEESFESSAENGSDCGEESIQKSDENVADMYEYFGMTIDNTSDEIDYNNYSANRQSYTDDAPYSVDRYDSNERYEETIYPLSNKSEDDINLMHGGGIFVEPSNESPGELLSGSGSEDDKDPSRDGSMDKKSSVTSKVSNDDVNNDVKVSIEVVEEKIIESFDFDQNRDTAEAMYYSLKKNEIEAQKRFQESIKESSIESEKCEVLSTAALNESLEEDNDDVVVLKSPSSAKAPKILKYGMSMDDRLLGSILSQDYSQKPRKIYPDDGFDPLLEESMRNHPLFLERLHEMSQSGEDEPPIAFEPDNMGDEDQFDDFFPGNIRSKIMASSISIADSDYFDPTNNKSIIDDDTIRTALETIHSTDSECSTIASAATKINAGERHNLMTRRNNNQYSSIGNAAIDKSLDDFIQAQEMRVVDKLDEEPEGSSISPPPPRKQQESNDDTWTSDTCTESDKKHTPGIIGIKLEQKSQFLTIDERRRTLHREDAIQRNSTRSQEEDSSKSSSSEKIIDKNILQSDAAIVTAVQGQSSIIDTEITVPVPEKQQPSKPSSNINKSVKHPIRRQKTMPVQIESNIIRVLPPKHLRKRIKSAESGDKKRKISK